MLIGIILVGSAAVYEIAPSVIPQQPIAIAPMPAFCSSGENFFLKTNEATPHPIGGIQIAIPTGAANV